MKEKRNKVTRDKQWASTLQNKRIDWNRFNASRIKIYKICWTKIIRLSTNKKFYYNYDIWKRAGFIRDRLCYLQMRHRFRIVSRSALIGTNRRREYFMRELWCWLLSARSQLVSSLNVIIAVIIFRNASHSWKPARLHRCFSRFPG